MPSHPLNIALIGHGRMNQAVEQQALLRGHNIAQVITDTEQLRNADLSNIDVACEFTTPASAIENMLILIEKGVTTVGGSTGCQERLSEVKQAVEQSDAGLLWSSNFSIGVNLFWKVIEQTTQLFDGFSEYDVYGHEWHHNNKADSPSGTARTTAQKILDNSSQKNELYVDALHRKPEEHELHFSSTRGGSVPGTHAVYFDSPADTIEIKHTARSSEGFARGTVLVAEWLQGKQGWYTMNDFMNEFST